MRKNSICLLSLLLIAAGCEKQKTGETKAERIIPITTTVSIEKKYAPDMIFTGTAFANKEANLGTSLPGRIEKCYFIEGQKVNKGDLIVELSSELYTQALIERNTLEKDFERVSRLRDKGSISEQDFDHVKAQYDASVAKTQMLKKSAEVRAPFAGTIVDYIVQEGENYFFSPNLKPGYSMTSGIVQLMQLDIIKVTVDVNEKDISKIYLNQSANVVFDAYPEKIFTGKVKSVEPTLSTLTRTAKVEIQINNTDLLIKPGMFARVKIFLPEQHAVFIPFESIYRQPGTGLEYVFVIDNNIAEKVQVSRKFSNEKFIAVDGLKPGKTIAVAGKSKLSTGCRVKVGK
ncbi:MAG: hypothetical protein A2X13_07835 [Bacteroidetes bacterium GWC2_33_15]|nr:MAG: hypothetical protein A2X10_04890 [Bacteroidetes bacterium GWA2_33_15]OFX52662.1 MAG: hypothetical protein A2X13_07835 [Bacteroidetes bacterium GWC2_33_15]OFX64032.1 MAG: hypothetical protein A2X15_02500 [Bacteroidetes bacterium GWB2_32_14]OFX67283.1 MAG: hypothetical protein A2X14_11915 [Bacteroidetes bacterium GWD2_33_33]HAN18858.1 efflux RND transporter periplasmic adaptor subunit [Bacteroidales bacterium]